jgi:nucleoside-specific outer membrane channel protein Tsx
MSVQQEETTMRKTILAALGAALIAVSAVQTSAAAERHHARKADRAAANEQLRLANNAVPATAQTGWPYSGFSAPAGR